MKTRQRDAKEMPEIKCIILKKPKGSARISYTSHFKLAVVTCALEKGNRAAAHQYQIDEKNVRKWRQNQAVLRDQRRDQRAARLCSPKFPDLEKELT